MIFHGLSVSGANVNRTTANNDHTVLSLACAGGHLAVVELLLAHGADPTHRLKVCTSDVSGSIVDSLFLNIRKSCTSSIYNDILSVFVFFCFIRGRYSLLNL